MRDSNRTISGVAGLVLGGYASMSLPALAEAGTSHRAVMTVAEGRMQATLDVRMDSTGRRAGAGIRMSRAGMAHRFHVAALDSTGQRVVAPHGWNVAIHGGSAATRPLISLSANASELDLPRPLGIRLEQADSIDIVATWTDSAASGITLLVTVDYDPMDGAASRLAVVPVGVTAIAAGALSRQWEFATTENGRLLALAGLPTEGLVSIAFIDVATGTTLWQSAASSTFGAPRPIARMGVALQGGHRYRIVATFAADESVRDQAIVGMVLPTR